MTATTGVIAMMIATGVIAIRTMIGVDAMAVTATIRRWLINRATRMASPLARMMARGDKATIRNALTFIETDIAMAADIMGTTDATVTVNSSRHIVKDFCRDMIKVIEAIVGHVTGAPATTDVGRFPFK